MIPLRDNIPTGRFPVVTVVFIAINVVVWLLYQLPDLEQSVVESAFYPCEISGCPDPADFSPQDQSFIPMPGGAGWIADAFTSMFMHGSWLHIAGNMLFLWIFGNNVEDQMGRAKFIVFYLAAGLAATALQTAITLEFGQTATAVNEFGEVVTSVNVDALVPTVGASGAIAGVLGAYLLLFPRARVLAIFFIILIIPIEIPAVFFLGGWFLFQLWQGGLDMFRPDDFATGGVAFFAHVGGFVFGFLAVKLFTARLPRGPLRPAPHPPWERAER